MNKNITATFDGQVLHPDAPLDLEPNKSYHITIQIEADPSTREDAWSVLEGLAGTIDAPSDWSVEHDHYLYGTPKSQAKMER